MSESQRPSFCPQCGHKLTTVARFCPECGARIADGAPSPAAPPTTIIPPEQATPVTTILPPEQVAAPPTTIIPPEQAAPATTILPPEQVAAPPTTIIPPERPAAPRTAPLSPEPAAAPAPSQPSSGGQSAPPIIPPAQSTGTRPDPFMSPPSLDKPASGLPSYQIPSSSDFPTTPPSNKSVGLLIGCIGLLLLIFIGACGFLVFSLSSFNINGMPSTPIIGESSTGGSGEVGVVTGGEIVFRDDFENPAESDLGASEDSSARYAYEQGHYVIEVKQPELLVWALVDGSYRDVVIEASYSIPRDSPDGAAGLIFHYQDADNFYLFSVSKDGYYALEMLKNDDWVTLIDWTQHRAINPETNRMRVELRGDEITLYVNDRRLEQTRDPTFTSGEVGLAVTSFDESGIVVRFDEITIRER